MRVVELIHETIYTQRSSKLLTASLGLELSYLEILHHRICE